MAFWDITNSLSYNALFNFIVGARGVGKTYGAKRLAIKRFLKDQSQFIYVRRYKQEFKRIANFWEDIAEEFPEHSFEAGKGVFKIDGIVAGYYIPLSTSKIEKSTPFPNVSLIIYDEFILDKGTYHYLPDEVTNFLEMYSTVARMRDNVIVYFLSNALTVTNPYFLYFNLEPPTNKKGIYCKNDILIEVVVNEEHTRKMNETRFGKIVSGTAYADYAFGNEFLRDTKDFLGKKPQDAQFKFSLKYMGEEIGIWYSPSQYEFYASPDINRQNEFAFAVTLDDHSTNTVLVKSIRNPLFKSFIKAYTLGKVTFESQNIKNICKEIARLTL